jgi:Fibronectin type III domain
VTAQNAVGTGPASAPSNSVVPATVPGAPTAATATAGDGQATVTFAPPTGDGGSAITLYTVTAHDQTNPANGGEIAGRRQPGPIIVTGLTLGDRYTFTVTASNAIGVGPPSAASNEVLIGTVPGSPTITSLTGGDGQVTVDFSPATPGVTPVTSYTVAATDVLVPAHGGQSASGPASPIIVEGLTNGDTYTFTVTATSAAGTSPPSAPSGRLVVGIPPTTIVLPSDGTVGVPYQSAFTADGVPAAHFTVISGQLPGGLQMQPDGTITGTPTAAGTSRLTVNADNGVGQTDSNAIITINPKASGLGGAQPPGMPGKPTAFARTGK